MPIREDYRVPDPYGPAPGQQRGRRHLGHRGLRGRKRHPVRGSDRAGRGRVRRRQHRRSQPDENITYYYCGALSAAETWFGSFCANGQDDRLYRVVTYFDSADTLQNYVEPLADFIDPTGPIFTYRCTADLGGPCSDPSDEPYRVTIDLRGRTKDPDPQSGEFKIFELTSDIRLMNMGGDPL